MRLAGGAELAQPTWVALLDAQCSVLLKTYIKPEVSRTATARGCLQLNQAIPSAGSSQVE
jgi:hypothetical protein